MMKNYIFKTVSVVFLLFFQLGFSQVGIGTTTPLSTLHVEGTMRVTNTNNTTVTTKLTGTCAQGIVADIKVGKGLALSANELVSTANNSTYGVALITILTPSPNLAFDNLNLDLNGANVDVVIFRLTGSTNNFSIAGISGGTNGRHIILYNSSSVNMKIDHLASSIAINKIDTIGTSTSTSGVGTVELVYDGTIQRWIVIAIRD
ncbi:MAG: hypothetical protein ABI426_04925 [Flavobacterium sp.]